MAISFDLGVGLKKNLFLWEGLDETNIMTSSILGFDKVKKNSKN